MDVSKSDSILRLLEIKHYMAFRFGRIDSLVIGEYTKFQVIEVGSNLLLYVIGDLTDKLNELAYLIGIKCVSQVEFKSFGRAASSGYVIAPHLAVVI